MFEILKEEFGTDPGYDFNWSGAEVLDAGGGLDEDFDTASVPGGAPAGWGPQCLKITTVTNGLSGRQHTFSNPRNKMFWYMEVVLGSESLADDEQALFGRLAGAGGAVPVFVYFRQILGVLNLRVNIQHDELVHNFDTPVNQNQRYKIEIKWDLTDDTWAWWLDGVLQNSGSLTSPSKPDRPAVGSPSISTGVADIYVGRIIISDKARVGPHEPFRQVGRATRFGK